MLKRLLTLAIAIEYIATAFAVYIINSVFTVISNGEYKFEIADFVVPALLIFFSVGIILRKQKICFLAGLSAFCFSVLLILFLTFYIFSGETIFITLQNGKELILTALFMSILSFLSGLYLIQSFRKK
jgi:hypothetical protein